MRSQERDSAETSQELLIGIRRMVTPSSPVSWGGLEDTSSCPTSSIKSWGSFLLLVFWWSVALKLGDKMQLSEQRAQAMMDGHQDDSGCSLSPALPWRSTRGWCSGLLRATEADTRERDNRSNTHWSKTFAWQSKQRNSLLNCPSPKGHRGSGSVCMGGILQKR